MIRHLRRWLPDRVLVVVTDSSPAVLELLACATGLRPPVTMVSCLQLDAALYDPAPERKMEEISRALFERLTETLHLPRNMDKV